LKAWELKDTQGAKQDLDQSIQLDPNPQDIRVYINRGILKIGLQYRAGAIENIRKAVKLYNQKKLGVESKQIAEIINDVLKILEITVV
jgi:tetratricopeptide (TPR) repeat protein